MTQRRIYQNEYPYFITARTVDGYPFFEKSKYAKLLTQDILVSSKIKGFNILCYQIMPDHIHLLICHNASLYRQRTLERVRWGWWKGRILLPSERMFSNMRSPGYRHNVSDLMQSIKGNFSRRIHQGSVWQKRFYHRIVNNYQYLENIIYYIKNNPNKEKLPPKYHISPYQYINWKLLNEL